MTMAVIYRIDCPQTGRLYIGSTINFESRKHAHVSELYYGRHICRALQKEFDDLGETAFVFSVIREVPKVQSLKLEAKEIKEATLRGEDLYNGVKGWRSPYLKVREAAVSEKKRGIQAQLPRLLLPEDVGYRLTITAFQVRLLTKLKSDPIPYLRLNLLTYRFNEADVDRWSLKMIERHGSVSALLT